MEPTGTPLKIAIVVGSVRPGNLTGLAASLVALELSRHSGIAHEIIRPELLALPFPGMPETPGVETLQNIVRGSAAVVLATPEYNGGFSSVIKIVIENLGYPSLLAGKPVALLGVASGVIGAVKSLEQLRSVVSHAGGLVLPKSCSLANVETVFDPAGACVDQNADRQIRKFAGSLVQYLDENVRPRLELARLLASKQ